MNFEFNENQDMLRDQARRFLGRFNSLDLCRKALEGQSPDTSLWREIGEMGWPATVIPEEFGGLGLGYLELCVLAEELGRSLAPVPFGSSVFLVAELIIRQGSSDQKADLLPALAGGDRIGALAVSEAPGIPGVQRVQAVVSNGRLRGTKFAVLDGAAANLLIVAAREEGADAPSLYIVDPSGPGVTRQVDASLDGGRPSATFQFDGAAATLLGAPGGAEAALRDVQDRAAVLIAFEQIGGAERALEMACAYARERKAFGRAIGSFQAMKHKLADLYVLCELAKANAYYGAWALSTDATELPVAAASARISACEAFEACATENMQVHGGMGFTWEADCHLFYRRAKLLSLALGAPLVWRDRLISLLMHRNMA